MPVEVPQRVANPRSKHFPAMKAGPAHEDRSRPTKADKSEACSGWRETATKAAGGRVSVEHQSGGSATCQRVRLSYQRRQKRSVKAGLAIEDIARGRGRGKVRSTKGAGAPCRASRRAQK